MYCKHIFSQSVDSPENISISEMQEYGVDVFERIEVSGKNMCPLWLFLQNKITRLNECWYVYSIFTYNIYN